MEDEIKIKFTKHARIKCSERELHLVDIEKVIARPSRTMRDTIDPELEHRIGSIGNRHLRVIGRWESDGVFLVVTAFLDRRLDRKG